MRAPSRMPVKAEQFLINTIGICSPHIQNPNIRFHLNVLAEQLQQELDSKMGRKIAKEKSSMRVDNSEGEDIKRFIALFLDRYTQETDMEYRTKLKPNEIGVMKTLVKKLREKDIDIEDYLSWVFDVFFDDPYNKEKFSPMIGLVCGTFVASRFFMNNRDKFRKKKTVEEKQTRRNAIREYAVKLFRRTKDSTIQKMLEREYNGAVTVEFLENWIKEKEEELQGENANV